MVRYVGFVIAVSFIVGCATEPGAPTVADHQYASFTYHVTQETAQRLGVSRRELTKAADDATLLSRLPLTRRNIENLKVSVRERDFRLGDIAELTFSDEGYGLGNDLRAVEPYVVGDGWYELLGLQRGRLQHGDLLRVEPPQ